MAKNIKVQILLLVFTAFLKSKKLLKQRKTHTWSIDF